MKAPMSSKSSARSSRLQHAAKKGSTGAARSLLASAADVGSCAPDGRTALMAAAGAARHGSIKLLLSKGADPNARTASGGTALLEAVFALHGFERRMVGNRLLRRRTCPIGTIVACVRALLRAGADPNALDREYGTPLIIAARGGSLPVVRMLVNAGADVNLRHPCGWSPLERAVLYPGYPQVVRLLLQHGADPAARDPDGTTVREIAERGAESGGKRLLEIRRMIRETRNRPRRRALRTRVLPERKSGARSPVWAKRPATETAPTGGNHFTDLMLAGQAEWAVLAVKAPPEDVARAFAKLRPGVRWYKEVQLKRAQRFERVSSLCALLRPKANPWTVVLRSVYHISSAEIVGVPKEAKALSGRLSTEAVAYLCESTANSVRYELYIKSRLKELAEWENGGALSRFSSSLGLKPPQQPVGLEFADQFFRRHGIYLPACYPCSNDKEMWISVVPISTRTIARADLLEFAPTPSNPADSLERCKQNCSHENAQNAQKFGEIYSSARPRRRLNRSSQAQKEV